jgi:hypothetical protein
MSLFFIIYFEYINKGNLLTRDKCPEQYRYDSNKISNLKRTHPILGRPHKVYHYHKTRVQKRY